MDRAFSEFPAELSIRYILNDNERPLSDALMNLLLFNFSVEVLNFMSPVYRAFHH